MRLRNIDIIRGVVMIIMCIDHARDYTLYHPLDPMDLDNTSFIVYALRILAHFCAPTFILLSGISISLQREKKTKKELSSYLLSRGLILCLLELTLVNWGWSFNPFYKMTYLQIIWAIGIAMITMAFLIHIKDKYIAILALIVIFGHNLFDFVSFPSHSIANYIWSFLEQKNVLEITDSWSVRTTYPVLPVIAIMALGFVVGYMYKKSFNAQNRVLILRSFACISFLLFLLFRMIIGYGDPYSVEWSELPILSVMSLFNVTKYPMSLQFILFTLSVTSLFLALTDSLKVKDNNPILVLGQVPLFFYISHLYVLHSIILIILAVEGVKIDLINNLGGVPSDFGVPLWWLLWIVLLILVILFPICTKYRHLKFSRKYKWTSYI